MLCDKLTCKSLGDISKCLDINEKLTEISVQERIQKVRGWPGFEKVFMVSALEGSGVGDIMVWLNIFIDKFYKICFLLVPNKFGVFSTNNIRLQTWNNFICVTA